MYDSEKKLATEVLNRAHVRSSDLAWRPAHIPAVIEAARLAHLINLGGDLQIRAPSGRWGEPIGFGIVIEVPHEFAWEKQVEAAAEAALAHFLFFQRHVDFEAIARESYPSLVAEVDDPQDVIFFSWAVADEAEASRLDALSARLDRARG
jgi:hypothetical protein